MKKLVAFLLVFALVGCSEGNSEDRAAEREQRLEQQRAELLEIEELVREEIGDLDESWHSLEFLDSTKGSYRFAINYREDLPTPSSRRVSQDTSRVVRTTLKVLMNQGRNPAEEWISVSVHSRQPAGEGETGAQLVRRLGSSSYNFNTDQIEFEHP